jgi:hypothetical protein
MDATPSRTWSAGTRPVHPWLSAAAVSILDREAVARRVHADRLAAQLLERVLCDGLIDAVLDA